MPASPARIAVNRRNAALSTGPRTSEGKERSRANACKHGLTGAGIALPVEDGAVVEARFRTLQEELTPRTTLGAVLVHQVALMSVRMERSARQESAALGDRIEQARADFDRSRLAEVDTLMLAIEANPGATRPQLLAIPAGVDRLIAGLLGIMADLIRPDFAWTPALERRVEAYAGRAPGHAPESRVVLFSRAVGGDFSRINPEDSARFDAAGDRHNGAIDELVLAIDAEVGRLCDHRRTMDETTTQRARGEAGERALFDPGKEAILARRYEAASSRAFYRALREFREIEAAPVAATNDPASCFPAFESRPAAEWQAPLPPTPPLNPPQPDPGVVVEAEEYRRNVEQINDLRGSLGSFGSEMVPSPARPGDALDPVTRRQNRPRVDPKSKRKRRRR